MFTRNNLLSIEDLKAESVLMSMDKVNFDGYCGELKTFVAEYPEYERALKSSFAASDIDEFSKQLLGIMHILKRIRAYDLEKSCAKLLDSIKTESREVNEAFLNYLFTSVSMLSIDLQIIMYKDDVGETGNACAACKAVFGEKSPKKILAVDDVSLILSILKTALQDTGCKFIGVTSAEAALKYISGNDPDLFILDIEMPGMNGYELAQRIKEMNKTAPIIFLTGNATNECVKKAIEAGADDFIVKPVNKLYVLDKIRKYL